jgi:hypothetical protein
MIFYGKLGSYKITNRNICRLMLFVNFIELMLWHFLIFFILFGMLGVSIIRKGDANPIAHLLENPAKIPHRKWKNSN